MTAMEDDGYERMAAVEDDETEFYDDDGIHWTLDEETGEWVETPESFEPLINEAQVSAYERSYRTDRARALQEASGVGDTTADRQNFSKMLLVFGCIGTDLCKKIRVLQHFSKSTRLSS